MDELIDKIRTISSKSDRDIFLFCCSVDYRTSDDFIKLVRARVIKTGRKANCSLILTTYGGDPDAGYRMVRMIKRYYKTLTLYVFGMCKSTGTLMALGADEIVMSDFGEFGPLDIQLSKEDELLNTSGLSYLQSLTSLSDQIYRSFEKTFFNVLAKSGYSITTKTAAEISSKLAIGLISPISAQIDPVRLGEVNRAITIADAYGARLGVDKVLIANLIVGYPSHGFVIDYEEAKTIFKNVRWVDEDEAALEHLLLNEIRREGTEPSIYDLMDLLEDKGENSGEQNAQKEEGVDEKNQPAPSFENANDHQNGTLVVSGPTLN